MNIALIESWIARTSGITTQKLAKMVPKQMKHSSPSLSNTIRSLALVNLQSLRWFRRKKMEVNFHKSIHKELWHLYSSSCDYRLYIGKRLSTSQDWERNKVYLVEKRSKLTLTTKFYFTIHSWNQFGLATQIQAFQYLPPLKIQLKITPLCNYPRKLSIS